MPEAQVYLLRAYLLLLDRTHGDDDIIRGRHLLRPCLTLDAMEKAEGYFAGMLASLREFGSSLHPRLRLRHEQETVETAVLLIRCAIRAEWYAVAAILYADRRKASADLTAARAALVKRCMKFHWMKGEMRQILT